MLLCTVPYLLRNMVWYCYETVNKVNGKYYRGKSGSSNPEKDGYLGSGTLLKKAIQKYGRAAFCKKILATFETEQEAYNYEANIVTMKEVNDPNCYNVQLGGIGSLKGTITVHKGDIETRIYPEHLSLYENSGWIKGVPGGSRASKEDFQKMSLERKGSVAIHKNAEIKHVKEQELPKYLEAGWLRGTGYVHSKQALQAMSDSHKGIRTYPITKEGVVKRVPFNLIKEFEKQGWKRGTGRPCSEAAKLGSSRSRKGKIAVWKEGHPTYINSEELEHYLTLGYSKQKKESYDRV